MELRVLCTVQGTVAAATIEGALRTSSIPAMTRAHDFGAWLFPNAGGGLGPVDVLVPEDRLAEAQDVLAAFEHPAAG